MRDSIVLNTYRDQFLVNKKRIRNESFFLFNEASNYALCLFSLETVSFLRPLALLDAKTLRPLAVAILALKPCLFLLFLFEG